jgi:hypothetical protein
MYSTTSFITIVAHKHDHSLNAVAIVTYVEIKPLKVQKVQMSFRAVEFVIFSKSHSITMTHVAKIIEIVGSSEQGRDEAVQAA